MVGLAGEVEPPPAVRPDRACRRRPARSRSTRPRPCSTCSSTNVPIRRSVSRVRRRRGPGRARPRPCASAIVTPSASRSARARSGSSAPVSSRDPAQATPNRAPSSSPKLTTPIGRAGRNPSAAQHVERGQRATPRRAARRRRRRRAPSPGASRGPAPAGRPRAASGSPHQAHWLPARSGHVEPAGRGRAGEPLPQRRVLARSRRTAGSRRCRVRPTGATLVPQRRERPRVRRRVGRSTVITRTASYAGAVDEHTDTRRGTAVAALAAAGIPHTVDPARPGRQPRRGGRRPRGRAARHHQDARRAARRRRLPASSSCPATASISWPKLRALLGVNRHVDAGRRDRPGGQRGTSGARSRRSARTRRLAGRRRRRPSARPHDLARRRRARACAFTARPAGRRRPGRCDAVGCR